MQVGLDVGVRPAGAAAVVAGTVDPAAAQPGARGAGNVGVGVVADVEHLLGLLDRLVDSGRTVIVIEHHQAVMAHADWIIDLGPGAGHDGGRVVFEGTPADLVAARSTLTGQHLADYVGD